MVGCKISRDISFSFPFFFLLLLYGPQVDPFFFSPFFLSACRIARGHEEISTHQAGRRRGSPQETPTASSLIATMSIEELRLFSQIPAKISLETLDDSITINFGEADNVIYLLSGFASLSHRW